MKISLWSIGKTKEKYLEEGVAIFEKRLTHYLSYESFIIPNIKRSNKLSADEVKSKEGAIILKKIASDDHLILLDEKGKMYSSVEFATFLERNFNQSHRNIIFLIGGAYGFSDEIYARANAKISLSKMTFSHQMVRLFFTEQLFRAMTILKNEPYHNE